MSTDERTINPLPSPLDGSTHVPGDKSISHRAVLFSAMAEGTSRVSGVLDSEDVRASIKAVRALGADVNLEKQLDGSLAGGITGWGAHGPRQPEEPIDCGNSGTTARLLMGIIAPWPVRVTLTGDDSLRSRPMRRIAAPLMKMGVRFEPDGQETLPMTEVGTPCLEPISYDAPMASAQLKTAVILAGVYAQGTTVLREPAPSRNHTELMLPEFGVETVAGKCTASVDRPERAARERGVRAGRPVLGGVFGVRRAHEARQRRPSGGREPQPRPHRLGPGARAHGRRSVHHGHRPFWQGALRHPFGAPHGRAARRRRARARRSRAWSTRFPCSRSWRRTPRA